MSKILLIEPCILRTARYLKKSPNSDDILNHELALAVLEQDFEAYRQLTHLDLTEEFQSKTDSKDEIFILTEPKRGFRPNLISLVDNSNEYIHFRDQKMNELVSLDFEPEIALEKIKKINPDIILLNDEITGVLSEETRDLYLEKYKEKSKNVLELKKASPYKGEHYIPRLNNGKPFRLNKGHLKGYSDGFGSLELALLLKKEKMPFSLWTENYRNSFHDAYILDIVTQDEVISFDKNFYRIAKIIDLAPRKPFTASSDQGSLLYGIKHLFGPNNYSPSDEKYNTYFTDGAIHVLNEMIKNGKKHALK